MWSDKSVNADELWGKIAQTASIRSGSAVTDISDVFGQAIACEMQICDRTIIPNLEDQWRRLWLLLSAYEARQIPLRVREIHLSAHATSTDPDDRGYRNEFYRILWEYRPTSSTLNNTDWEKIYLLTLHIQRLDGKEQEVPIGFTSPTTLLCPSRDFDNYIFKTWDKDAWSRNETPPQIAYSSMCAGSRPCWSLFDQIYNEQRWIEDYLEIGSIGHTTPGTIDRSYTRKLECSKSIDPYVKAYLDNVRVKLEQLFSIASTKPMRNRSETELSSKVLAKIRKVRGSLGNLSGTSSSVVMCDSGQNRLISESGNTRIAIPYPLLEAVMQYPCLCQNGLEPRHKQLLNWRSFGDPNSIFSDTLLLLEERGAMGKKYMRHFIKRAQGKDYSVHQIVNIINGEGRPNETPFLDEIASLPLTNTFIQALQEQDGKLLNAIGAMFSVERAEVETTPQYYKVKLELTYKTSKDQVESISFHRYYPASHVKRIDAYRLHIDVFPRQPRYGQDCLIFASTPKKNISIVNTDNDIIVPRVIKPGENQADVYTTLISTRHMFMLRQMQDAQELATGTFLLSLEAGLKKSKKARIAVDFGTSNTSVSVMVGSGESRKTLDLLAGRTQLVSNESRSPSDNSVASECFFADEDALDRHGMLPTLTINHNPQLTELSLFRNANVYTLLNEEEYASVFGDSRSVKIYSNLKWINMEDVDHNDETKRKNHCAEIFLQQVTMQAAMLAYEEGCTEADIYYSYPLALKEKQRGEVQTRWKNAISELSKWLPQFTFSLYDVAKGIAQTECVTVAKYMINRYLEYSEDTVGIAIDIGGGTTDFSIAIPQSGKGSGKNVKYNLAHGSLRLGGRAIFAKTLPKSVFLAWHKELYPANGSDGETSAQERALIDMLAKCPDQDKDTEMFLLEQLLKSMIEEDVMRRMLASAGNMTKEIKRYMDGKMKLLFYIIGQSIANEVEAALSKISKPKFKILLAGNGSKLLRFTSTSYNAGKKFLIDDIRNNYVKALINGIISEKSGITLRPSDFEVLCSFPLDADDPDECKHEVAHGLLLPDDCIRRAQDSVSPLSPETLTVKESSYLIEMFDEHFDVPLSSCFVQEILSEIADKPVQLQGGNV